MAKMWAGRFSKEVDETVNAFNSSIAFDSAMYKQDIEGSLAHARMLGDRGIISPEDAKAIDEGLRGILSDLESGALEIDPEAEDIHMFVEAELTRRIGDAGKRLHTARSRNDQVALDLRLWLRDEIGEIRSLLKTLRQTLLELAEKHTETLMPGYTHLQRAQPVTLAHHLLAYFWMLTRDDGRLRDAAARMNYCPLGAGALAGTSYPIDREETARLLGFDAPVPNSLDAVSDRDFCVETVSALSLLMVHLSRFSEEIILWCSWEFRFAELDDAYATGSSIMPQKKNPDVTELIRGKTARAIGDLNTLLTMLKGLPLAYNKDLQEDKEAVFDAVATVKLSLRTFTPMLRTMRFHAENARAAAAEGFLNATDCADYLTRKGLPFRDAYKITGGLVKLCVEKGVTLETLPLSDFKAACGLFEEDVYDAIAMERCLESRDCFGAPAKKAVEEQLALARAALEESNV